MRLGSWPSLLRVLAMCSVLWLSRELSAQAPAPSSPDAGQNTAVRAYLDCQEWGCDREFLVTEMKWVNWMRERLDAEIHVLITSAATGSGGRRYTAVAIGQKQYAGTADTLTYTSNANDASDTQRRGLLRVISQLLLPYAAKTPLGARLSVAFAAPAGGAAAAPAAARDRWNFWTYSISANGFANGEKRQSFKDLSGSLDANRTTDTWKIRINGNYSYDQSSFSFSNGATYGTLQRSFGVSTMAVRSLGAHWSVGGKAQADRSDYYNTDLNMVVGPAVEWDYWPYAEYTRRRLTVLYSVGLQHYDYQQTTIYDKDRETRPMHYLAVGLSKRQPSGSASVSLSGSQFLNALKHYNASVHGNVDLRLGKGFSVNLGGSVSRVRDQLYLPRGEATDEDVIARQQALSTNYRYFLMGGLRYQFGSIFNSVVNQRFGAFGGGGRTIMMSF
ncbi:MAG: hypothetical protein FJ363_01745 [Gemmatimonadetes bacterium]|nr:hypothetical protein [Gemmatimonadota bacterium]